MARLLLLMDDEEERRRLAEHLAAEHEVLAPEPNTPDAAGDRGLGAEVDLCLADAAALERHGERLHELRSTARPVFLPTLLLASLEEVEQATEATWELVDDAAVAPFERPVLDNRIRALLRTRQLSLLAHAELCQSRESLETANAELARLQERMVQQERMHALGEMASGIAHDFRNALSVILGYGEMLLEDEDAGEVGEVARRSLSKIVTAARDASAAVERLRSFYRQRDEGEPFWPVELNRVVEEAAELTRPRWRDRLRATGVEVRLDVALGDPPRVLGHESELRDALTNLIFNAVDAMPDGGTITVQTAAEDGDAVIRVRDTGRGMDEESRRRCLEPFFTTKGEQGTGLGLAMVFGAVGRHHGSLEIDSLVGQGTTVTVRIPPLAEVQRLDEPTGGVEALERPLRILLVDDLDDVRSALAEQLERDGHEVETAVDGREGLERFAAGRFDLVITDWSMPGLDGEQLAAAIRETVPDQPLLMVTGFDDPADGPRRAPGTVDALLRKPVDIAELRRAMCEVVDLQRSGRNS